MVTHIVNRITQSQGVKDQFIPCAQIKNGEQCKFYVATSKEGREYLVVINHKHDDIELQKVRTEIQKERCLEYRIHQNNLNLPYCECSDWKKFQLPCKHILAVMRKYDFNWESFPEAYKRSVFFTLDESTVYFASKSENVVSISDTEESAQNNAETILKEIPTKVFPKRTKASSCRELLNEIKNLTYIVYETDALDVLEEQLVVALEGFRQFAQSDSGLLIRDFKRKPTQAEKKFDKLPQPKNRKSKFTGRVGRLNENNKFYSEISIDQKNSPVRYLQEQQISIDNDIYDIPINPPGVENNIVVSEAPFSNTSDDVDAKIVIPMQDYQDDVNDVIITKEVANNGEPLRKKRKIVFSESERSTILNNMMLTDESINMAQQMLADQFPEFEGFFDTVLGATQSFDIITSDKKFIQVLHTGHLHWICVANTSAAKSTNQICHVYDSLSSGKVKTKVLQQIASFSYCKEKELVINIQSVQQQSNDVDCGLFSLAFATSLAYGDNPTKIFFDENSMRPHLLKCIEQGKVTPFPAPKDNKKRLRCKSVDLIVELYCVCRMPYSREQEDMAECSNCLEWFHRGCEIIGDVKLYLIKFFL